MSESQARFNPFFSREVAPANSAHWEAKRRVAAAIRELNEVLVSSVPDTQELHSIAEKLEATATEFAATDRVFGRFEYAKDGRFGDHGEVVHELNPLSGLSNPVSPPLNIWLDGERAHARVTMGWRYEGPPGCVHGGFVAALFDEFLGAAQVLGGNPGMTGTLSVRYQRPTPLDTELSMTAWLERVDGRKTWMTAEISANGVVTAKAECLFIRPAKPLWHADSETNNQGE